MTRDEIVEFLTEQVGDDETLLLADGFEGAFIGISSRGFNGPPCAVYDRNKCIGILMLRDGMTFEEAEEFFDFNVGGAWLGYQTPIYLTPIKPVLVERADV